MATKAKAKKRSHKPEKVLINVKIWKSEKLLLKSVAKRYSRGNVTKLVRLLANGKFKPIAKAA